MLLDSSRLTRSDRAEWQRHEHHDNILGQSISWEEKISAAVAVTVRFNPSYAAISWGKDSLVLAHIIASSALEIPLVWVRIIGSENPCCFDARDAFLAEHQRVVYREIGVGGRDGWRKGFAEAEEEFGERYLSGVRADESSERRLRVRKGPTVGRTCAPIGRWTTPQIFAYCARFGVGLPAVYAMATGAAIRDRRRVAAIGGERGRSRGRGEWERRYFPDVVSGAWRPPPVWSNP